ncbi:hypothetical protein J4558_11645 [Leptolyngbya sp. 15MV]|nr:hypothetical protein J4558_11645 [Leptolyngbya sp. 15MV]
MRLLTLLGVADAFRTQVDGPICRCTQDPRADRPGAGDVHEHRRHTSRPDCERRDPRDQPHRDASRDHAEDRGARGEPQEHRAGPSQGHQQRPRAVLAHPEGRQQLVLRAARADRVDQPRDRHAGTQRGEEHRHRRQPRQALPRRRPHAELQRQGPVAALRRHRRHRQAPHRPSTEDFYKTKVDVLVPAALEQMIKEKEAKWIAAKVVAEGANAPTTPAGDRVLSDRGIEVIPAILANAGGVTVSYFEWVQNKTCTIWDLEEVDRKLNQHMVAAARRTLAARERFDVDMRTAAYIAALDHIAKAYEIRGIFP